MTKYGRMQSTSGFCSTVLPSGRSDGLPNHACTWAAETAYRRLLSPVLADTCRQSCGSISNASFSCCATLCRRV